MKTIKKQLRQEEVARSKFSSSEANELELKLEIAKDEKDEEAFQKTFDVEMQEVDDLSRDPGAPNVDPASTLFIFLVLENGE